MTVGVNDDLKSIVDTAMTVARAIGNNLGKSLI